MRKMLFCVANPGTYNTQWKPKFSITVEHIDRTTDMRVFLPNGKQANKVSDYHRWYELRDFDEAKDYVLTKMSEFIKGKERDLADLKETQAVIAAFKL